MDNFYNDYPIVRMASLFNINRGGFYRWKKYPFTRREIEDTRLSKKIKRIFFDNKHRYGSPRIARELKEEGITCSKNRACRLMRESNLVPKARRKFRITTNSNHNHKASPDLVQRNFKPPKPGQAGFIYV